MQLECRCSNDTNALSNLYISNAVHLDSQWSHLKYLNKLVLIVIAIPYDYIWYIVTNKMT